MKINRLAKSETEVMVIDEPVLPGYGYNVKHHYNSIKYGKMLTDVFILYYR